MSTLRGNIVSATQARDLYNITDPLMVTNGWVDVTGASPIIDGGIEWHVWRNPAANSGLPNDYHIAIGFATSGTGSMFFRMFETWIGLSADPVLDKYEYGCRRPVPTLTGVAVGGLTPSPDAYGLNLQPYQANGNGAVYPQVSTPRFRYWTGSTPFTTPTAEFNTYTDYSLAAWIFHASSGSFQRAYVNDDVLALLRRAAQEGGVPMDFRSKYVAQRTLLVDDETAVEYVVHVSPKGVMMATARIFNDTWSTMYWGSMEEAPPWDPMPITLHQGLAGSTSGQGSFTRVFKFTDDQPFSWGDITNNNSEANPEAFGGYVSASFYAAAWEAYTDRYAQPSTNLPTTTNALALAYKGPVAARVMVRDAQQHLRGLLPESVLVTWISNPFESPQMGFGDETTINGQEYIFIGIGGTNDGVQQVKNQSTNTSYALRFGFWVKKD